MCDWSGFLWSWCFAFMQAKINKSWDVFVWIAVFIYLLLVLTIPGRFLCSQFCWVVAFMYPNSPSLKSVSCLLCVTSPNVLFEVVQFIGSFKGRLIPPFHQLGASSGLVLVLVRQRFNFWTFKEPVSFSMRWRATSFTLLYPSGYVFAFPAGFYLFNFSWSG